MLSRRTQKAIKAVLLAQEESRRLGHNFVGTEQILLGLIGQNYIGSEHLLLALLREDEGVAARVLENLGADPSESPEAVGAGVGGGSSGNKMPTLEEYGTNLTKLAEEGKLDPAFGRQQEIELVTQILVQRTENYPCLIGEPGVGMTVIVEGLAQRTANGDVPETIEEKKGKLLYET
ncbi:ATP-dependent Clp protease ATP-binding subunit homolog CD4B, chloroplastic-like [Olea europaea subsp. europaea]|uniref:ATP-dependent Clp protease ATP-binding subunit homolog CD4B, chloroplastic-like n=1 Tax=Olea europaea subsp. europaea TaxID=158383 RepID=A0A8S0QEF7_OLEEU|nr:ATP-dependent Clp protease ATP-binding subunit homolog CD4B, chloroplastic-like [Olea europaea subsp. europaea]